MLFENRRLNHNNAAITIATIGGANKITSSEISCSVCKVDAVLITKAIVPGPAVAGIANGTKLILELDCADSNGADPAALAGGNNIVNPMNATINPPAIL